MNRAISIFFVTLGSIGLFWLFVALAYKLAGTIGLLLSLSVLLAAMVAFLSTVKLT